MTRDPEAAEVVRQWDSQEQQMTQGCFSVNGSWTGTSYFS